jgi:uncharacterized protein (DUF849 family)
VAPVCHENVEVPEGVVVPYTPDEVAAEAIACARMGVGMGARVLRFGFEDSFGMGENRLATNNMQLLENLLQWMKKLDLETMTPDEARNMIGIV